ncbi:MAG: hypothetical protein AB7O62_04770 [Pirellulales bacterium]
MSWLRSTKVKIGLLVGVHLLLLAGAIAAAEMLPDSRVTALAIPPIACVQIGITIICMGFGPFRAPARLLLALLLVVQLAIPAWAMKIAGRPPTDSWLAALIANWSWSHFEQTSIVALGLLVALFPIRHWLVRIERNPPVAPTRRFQFGLRSLFLLTLVAAGLLAGAR